MDVVVHELRIEDEAENVPEDAAGLPNDAPAGRLRMPISVALVWLCAFAGLGVYAVGTCFPQWVSP